MSPSRSSPPTPFPTPQEGVTAWLRRPEAYPEGTRRVEVIETHMARVFLTDRHAYKLKKPVRLGPVQYDTLDARRRACFEEFRLNRRLARWVYLGVVSIVASKGAFNLGGPGIPVDWLVKMRRLPDEGLLDHALATDAVDIGRLHRTAALLGRFYAGSRPALRSGRAYSARLRRQIRSIEQTATAYSSFMPRHPIATASARLLAFVDRQAALLDARVRAGRIIEGHGDLRPQHVFLGPPPAVIDCLEFSRELRTLDVAEDLSLLSMECKRLGAAEVGRSFVAACLRVARDRPPSHLLTFFEGLQALRRARLAALHAFNHDVTPDPAWMSRAAVYSHLAAETTERLP